MAMSNLRVQVLQQFKSLHRVRKKIFKGDDKSLNAAKIQINENFRKNKEIEDPKEIQKLIEFAKEVEYELKSNVIQAIQTKPGVFEIQINQDALLNNVSYKEIEDIRPCKLPPKTKNKKF